MKKNEIEDRGTSKDIANASIIGLDKADFLPVYLIIY